MTKIEKLEQLIKDEYNVTVSLNNEPFKSMFQNFLTNVKREQNLIASGNFSHYDYFQECEDNFDEMGYKSVDECIQCEADTLMLIAMGR